MVTYHLVKHSQHYLIVNIADDSPHEKFAEEVFRKYQISPREQEIVSLLLQGYSNQKIAEILFISVSTVKFHLSNIYAKFGVKSRYEVLTFFRNAEKDRSMN
jgi:DNA-binding CsgD family transcriptional regulator